MRRWLNEPFGYAKGRNADGYHTGVVMRELGNVYFDDTSLLVHPDHVDRPPELDLCPNCGKALADCVCDVPPIHCTKCEKPEDECICDDPKTLKRYYGRVVIDPMRVHKDMKVIVDEVIQRLTSQIGCNVEVTLEINAKRPEGFDEGTVRTISENSRTLKFEQSGFDEG